MYEITVNDGFMGVLLKELRAWRVPASNYEVNGTTVTTKSKNVVDVATETFIDASHLIRIERK